MTDKADVFISSTTQRRLLKDVRDLVRNPLTEQGIYYAHDEEDMLTGYALIFGPPDTLYADGAYFFKFAFPSDYPFRPPKLHFLTHNGSTRFNPNLYRSGKVCLSILNTWKGEQWTSCQSIRSVLMTLVILFHDKPLLNEPGIRETHEDFLPYNHILRYRNYETSILGMLSHELLPKGFASFFPFVKQRIIREGDNIMQRLSVLATSDLNGKTMAVNIYRMKCTLNYSDVMTKLSLAIYLLSQN
jgi:ubiquitin-conjugating enzyme E2 Z